MFYKESDYYTIQQGVASILKLLNTLSAFATANDFSVLPKLLQEIHSTITAVLIDEDFEIVKLLNNKIKLGALDVTRLDYVFRSLKSEEIKILLGIVYQLDVFTTVSEEGKKLGFSLPVINTNGEKILRVESVFHPFVNSPVTNDIEFDYNRNICFVTGTNMAGKSTFLKSIGVCVFLSQLGFPVPAAHMTTSTFKGLITTINLSDDIQLGHSHFIARFCGLSMWPKSLTNRRICL